MENIQFFKDLDLKAQDAHFVIRGAVPTKNIQLIEIDEKSKKNYTELSLFWHQHYADAMRAVAAGGGKVMVLDIAFGINVERYVKGYDAVLAGAFAEVAPQMPIVCAFVPATVEEQQNPDLMVPLNMMASAFQLSAFPNLTSDDDDFIRRQELIEQANPDQPGEGLTRGMALRAAEKYLGKDAELHNGKLYLAGREIPMDARRTMTINYAGPADTFPRVSLYDVVEAFHAGNTAQLKKWFEGKVVLLGTDDISGPSRYAVLHPPSRATANGRRLESRFTPTS